MANFEGWRVRESRCAVLAGAGRKHHTQRITATRQKGRIVLVKASIKTAKSSCPADTSAEGSSINCRTSAFNRLRQMIKLEVTVAVAFAAPPGPPKVARARAAGRTSTSTDLVHWTRCTR